MSETIDEVWERLVNDRVGCVERQRIVVEAIEDGLSDDSVGLAEWRRQTIEGLAKGPPQVASEG